ncbi:hypothetical protein ACWI_31170 [Acetobacterium wieringae]|uniref:Uncharacterized protein n=2 Tax=Acetobacterium wieringae TaxID=52694 RepID=A0A1F2PDA6_9FIRM|nr:hypothetical protein ACWI_31170 [Acetobacterium wieringae]
MIVITDKKNDSIAYLAIKHDIVENGIKVRAADGFECIIPDNGSFLLFDIGVVPEYVNPGYYKYTKDGGFVKNQDYVPFIPLEEKAKQLENELLNTKLAMVELVEQQQADKLNNQLALAEVIESIGNCEMKKI